MTTGAGSPGTADEMDLWVDGGRGSLLDAFLDRAVTVPSSAIRKHVESLCRRNPEASPRQIVQILEKEYLAVVSTAGGAVGAAAAIPAVGTAGAAALTTGDIATFFATSAAFALAVAEVHGISTDDVARRRALLLASVLGEKGARDVESAVGGSQLAWGKVLLTTMPKTTLKRVNQVLTHRFVRRQIAKQGTLALGRMIPFGVGAVIGYTGGRALGHGVVVQTRSAFGLPPERFPARLTGTVRGIPSGSPRALDVLHDDGSRSDA